MVLKGTVEDQWFRKSMEGFDYVEINEQELDMILQKKKISNKRKIKQEKTIISDIFRF